MNNTAYLCILIDSSYITPIIIHIGIYSTEPQNLTVTKTYHHYALLFKVKMENFQDALDYMKMHIKNSTHMHWIYKVNPDL